MAEYLKSLPPVEGPPRPKKKGRQRRLSRDGLWAAARDQGVNAAVTGSRRSGSRTGTIINGLRGTGAAILVRFGSAARLAAATSVCGRSEVPIR